MFAPIGAIFIYQMLVVSDTAGNQLTVALASLAAGLSLYWLLGKALKLVESLLKPSDDTSVGGDGGTAGARQTGESGAVETNSAGG